MKSVECGSCKTACCQNVELPLSLRGHQILQQAGTELIELGSDERDTDFTNYLIIGKCGLLDQETNLCKAYDLERPDICVQFAAGSIECIDARQRRGIPTEIDLFIEEPDGIASINPISWQHLNDFTTPILSQA